MNGEVAAPMKPKAMMKLPMNSPMVRRPRSKRSSASVSRPCCSSRVL
jgi:hypothetical protein